MFFILSILCSFKIKLYYRFDPFFELIVTVLRINSNSPMRLMKIKEVGVIFHRFLRTILQHSIDEIHRDLFIYMYEIYNYTFRRLPSARTKTTITDYHAKVVLTTQILYNMAAISNWWALNLGGDTNKCLTVLSRLLSSP